MKEKIHISGTFRNKNAESIKKSVTEKIEKIINIQIKKSEIKFRGWIWWLRSEFTAVYQLRIKTSWKPMTVRAYIIRKPCFGTTATSETGKFMIYTVTMDTVALTADVPNSTVCSMTVQMEKSTLSSVKTSHVFQGILL